MPRPPTNVVLGVQRVRAPVSIEAVSAGTGLAYGLFLEVLVLNLIVNSIDDPNVLYQSTPSWSWWLAHGVYGLTLGLAAAPLLGRRTAPG